MYVVELAYSTNLVLVWKLLFECQDFWYMAC